MHLQTASRSYRRRLLVAAKPRKPARSDYSGRPNSSHRARPVHHSKQPAVRFHRRPTAKRRQTVKRAPTKPAHKPQPHRQSGKPASDGRPKPAPASAKVAVKAVAPAGKQPSPTPVSRPTAGRSPTRSTVGEGNSRSPHTVLPAADVISEHIQRRYRPGPCQGTYARCLRVPLCMPWGSRSAAYGRAGRATSEHSGSGATGEQQREQQSQQRQQQQ